MKAFVNIVLALIFITCTAFSQDNAVLLQKKWKIVKHQKAGKSAPTSSDDYIQFGTAGHYDQVVNKYYSKGTWALVDKELFMNHNGEYKWKIVSVTENSLSLSRGADELMDLEVLPPPPAVDKSKTSPNVQHLCIGKWRPSEHHRGESAIKFLPEDVVTFFVDGSLEQIIGGAYSRGTWSFNQDETQLTINGTVWKVETLSGIFFKLSNVKEPKEFFIYAKTR